MSLEDGDNVNHDIDVEEAIASSLKSIAQGVDVTDDTSQSQNQNKVLFDTDTPQETVETDNHEADLQNIIGDTINQLYLDKVSDTNDRVQHLENDVGSNANKVEDEVIENQITKDDKEIHAENIINSNNSTTDESSSKVLNNHQSNTDFEGFIGSISDNVQSHDNVIDKQISLDKDTREKENQLENLEDDIDLADVIGNAFKDVMKGSNQDESEINVSNTYNISTNKSESYSNDVNVPAHELKDHDKNTEFDLETVVGNAFQSLLDNTNEKTKDESEKPNYSRSNTDSENNLKSKNGHQEGDTNAHEDSNKLNEHNKMNDVDDDENLKSLETMINDFETNNANEKETESPKDLDLDEAIGNAFKNLIPDISIQEIEDKQKESDDLDLELAIGDAFKSIQGNFEPDDTKKISKPNVSPYTNEEDNSNDNDELSAVISASLKQVTGQYFGSSQNSGNNVDTQNKALPSDQNISDKESIPPVDFSNIVQNIVNQMATSDEVSNASVENSISEDILQELAQEITNQVQSQLLEDQSTKKSKALTNMPQIDDTVVDHFQYEAHKDENEELKKSTNRLSEDSLQAALATVVRNAIESNATTLTESNNKTSSISGISTSEQHETDLEKLQMNDILQNAFNMAMENPHDLLSNLEMADDDLPNKSYTINDKSTNDSVLSKTFGKTTNSLPNSTSMFLESLNRSNEIDLNSTRDNLKKSFSQKNKTSLTSTPNDRLVAVAKNIMNNINSKVDDSKRKSMSIAETLALHRSSMSNAAKRDYSSIESLEEALKSENYQTSSFNSKVSSVLSSLSSRIHTAGIGTENNLLQIIRQMTNTLTSGSHSYLYSSGSPSVTDIISNYKGSENERSIVNSLLLAKKFLSERQFTVYNDKAIALINNVLTLFNASVSDLNIKDSYNLPNVKTDMISSISNSVISAISTYSNSKGARSSLFLGEKPKVDSPEYKERIRLENRERKKKWREENSERNKDNDLRSRVLKRAAAMFGDSDSQEKRAWVDDEFNRRRDKRIAKQKKDEQEKQNKQILDDGTSTKKYKDKESNSLASDPNLIKSVSDIFNIVTGLTYREDPQAALAATSAATATAAAIYANNNDKNDLKVLDGAVSIILSSLMESPNSAGQHERLANLSKGVTSSFKINTSVSTSNKQPSLPSLPSRLPDPELSSLIKGSSTGSTILNRLSSSIKGLTGLNGDNLSSSLLKLQRFNIDDGKRKPTDTLPYSDIKKQKLDESANLSSHINDNEKESISKIASNLDHIRSTITNTTSHIWSSSNTLKMPQYKRPEFSTDQNNNQTTSLIDKQNIQPKSEHSTTVSPFISHKVSFGGGLNNGINNSGVETKIVPGLKKPGSFQRPSYKKPDKSKTRSLGFPPLYSTSFTSNNS